MKMLRSLLFNMYSMMRSRSNVATSDRQYTSTVQTVMYILKNEGVSSLWKGFGAYFARGGGHTIFMFIFLEQYRKLVENAYKD